jgi:hypothetical protein
MDSLDIRNTLVLGADDLPPEVKELLSRLQPGDKVKVTDGTFTLVENGEKVVTLAINDGDGLTIAADPGEESVSFKFGDTEEPVTPGPGDEEGEKSASVETMKSGTYNEPVPQ